VPETAIRQQNPAAHYALSRGFNWIANALAGIPALRKIEFLRSINPLAEKSPEGLRVIYHGKAVDHVVYVVSTESMVRLLADSRRASWID